MNRRKRESLHGSGWSFLLILIVTAVLLCSGGTLRASTASGDLNVDISVKSRPLKEVVNLVQEQTGYRVDLKSIDVSFPVTGSYSDTGVEKIFTHLLKGYNISVAINSPDKLISVISLGGKIQRAGGPQELQSTQPVSSGVKEAEAILPVPPEQESISVNESVSDQSLELTGLSAQAVQELHAQQAHEFQQQQNDPGAVDPFTGLTPAALETMHAKQIMELDQVVK